MGRKKWSPTIKYLVEQKIITVDRNFIPDKKCYGYRLEPSHRRFRRIEVKAPKIAKFRSENCATEHKRWSKVHHWLSDSVQQLEIDAEAAEQIIKYLKPKKKRRKRDLSTHEYRDLLRAQVVQIGEGIQKLDKYGRIHSPLTSLPKNLRQFVTYKGEHLVQYDIKNSQPLFLGILSLSYYGGSNATKTRMRQREFKEESKLKYNTRRTETEGREKHQVYTTAENAKSIRNTAINTKSNPFNIPEDVFRYIDLCESGKLYERLGEPEKRKRTKRLLMVWLNEDPMNCYSNPVGTKFREFYPSVANLVDDLKFDQYQRLAWTLQHREASFVIGQVATRIMREHPECPIFTIHDAVLTAPQFPKYVEGIMHEEFLKIGFRPKLDLERLSPQPKNKNKRRHQKSTANC
jgi:hypothetical protein